MGLHFHNASLHGNYAISAARATHDVVIANPWLSGSSSVVTMQIGWDGKQVASSFSPRLLAYNTSTGSAL